MGKWLKSLIDSDIPNWVKIAVALSVVAVLLRTAGIPVADYVDVALREVFDRAPGLKSFLVGMCVAILLRPITHGLLNVLNECFHIPREELMRTAFWIFVLAITGLWIWLIIDWIV